MPLADFANELVGQTPHLSYLLALTMVNRAWADCRDSHLWSFLVGEGALLAPAVISAGTVSVTNGSVTVTLDATATAALNAVVLANPPLVSTLVGTGRQFRVGAGPLYNIVNFFAAANTITLDLPYGEATASAQPYQVYRAYYAPPSPDFLRFLSILNTLQFYAITGRKLYVSREELDQRDPQRGATGDAYYAANYKPDVNGNPVYELWPHPVNLTAYRVVYLRRGIDLVGTTDTPATFPKYALMARAEYYAAQWAVKNAGRYKELQGTDWRFVMAEATRNFNTELVKARKQDREIFLHTPILPKGYAANFPVDGRYMQSHDVGTMP